MVLREEMTTKPEKSKTLHNFTLPNLKWGSQRLLKCMKIDPTTSSGSGDQRLRRRSPPFKSAESSISTPVENGRDEEGIEEFRVKLMTDLKTVRENITQSMFREENAIEFEEEEKEREISPVRPWNLRKRKSAFNGFNQINKDEKLANPSPSRRMKEPRPKFSVNLSKKEIEEDFMAVLGRRPPRRPEKRPRNVQRVLDNLFPGLYLYEVTLDSYKIQEEKKR